MKLHRVLPALTPLLFAAACATGPTAGQAGLRPTPGDVEFDQADPRDGPVSAYGKFLVGRAAMGEGDNATATRYFEEAGAAGVTGADFQRRAFIAAIMGGDIKRASALAPAGEEAGITLQRLGALTRVVESLGEGRGKEAQDLLASGAVSVPHRPAAALLTPWAAAMAGDKEGALARPDLRGDRLVEVFGQLGQAELFERAKRYDEAEADYAALSGMGDAGILFMLDHGGFLERRARRKEAIALYDRALQTAPNDLGLRAARARAASGGKAPPLRTVRQGAARALMPSASAFVGDRQNEMALAYLRMVLYLDPQRIDAKVLLGDVLTSLRDVEGARAAYTAVPADSPYYPTARAKLAWTYQVDDKGEEGLALARQGYEAAPTDRDAAVTYADLLRANDRYAESAKVLDGVIAQAGDRPDWRLLYMRGIALERSGQWPAAEKDLTAALAQEPNEPDLLNYLGYAWIDRGERMSEAMDMVRRAVAANPRSGAMVDSLGWAYYRIGDYRNAVEKLEEAVLLSPADPEINNHLGDAYWRVGRKIEAEFQWNRALALKPTPEIKADAEAKLKSGLPPAKPIPVAAQ